MDQFIACWEELEDPRTGNAGLHDFHDLLMIALCTVLCGDQGAVDMALFAAAKEPFLRGFLKLEHGVPSHDTFSRLFRYLDPTQFRAAFQRFMTSFSERIQGVVAIDGKVLRRSFDRASGKSPLHMVSAWGCEQRLVLAQIATDAKSNEITAVPKLLEMLSLKGTIVTVDALNCQRDIAQQIVAQGGDYVLALKGNQGTLHDDVVRFLDDPESKASTAKPVVDADHGRIETRTATVSTDIGWLQEAHHWPGLAAIGKVVRIRETPGKTDRQRAAGPSRGRQRNAVHVPPGRADHRQCAGRRGAGADAWRPGFDRACDAYRPGDGGGVRRLRHGVELAAGDSSAGLISFPRPCGRGLPRRRRCRHARRTRRPGFPGSGGLPTARCRRSRGGPCRPPARPTRCTGGAG